MGFMNACRLNMEGIEGGERKEKGGESDGRARLVVDRAENGGRMDSKYQ